MKVHHIVFHDDIDGIVSAAIYLHDHVGDDDYRLYPVQSINRGEKFDALIESMRLRNEVDFLVILDYENNKRSDLWIDHHWSKVMGNNRVINDKIIYDHSAKSTASLMYQSLKPTIENEEYSHKFLKLVDTIDTAGYDTVNQVFNNIHPIMILRAYVERAYPSDMKFCRIVEMISSTHFDFGKALYQLKITKKVLHELHKDVKRTKRAMVISNNISIIRQSWPGKHPRYAEFYIDPKIKYSVRLSSISQNNIYFQVGYNKWHKQINKTDIGRMLSNMNYLVKGGGHHNVGGGIVSEQNTERLLDDLCINLDNEESMENEMEKVGVDKECDPVEAKAESMVKTGESKDINEARKKVSESDKEVKDGKKD